MTAAVIHPRFMALQSPAWFPLLVTIEQKAETLDDYGQPVETWTASAGMMGTKAPLSAQERQAANYTATDQVWHVLVDGPHPQITTRHRAVIDGATYDIDAVETDQTGNLTRLRVRLVEV